MRKLLLISCCCLCVGQSFSQAIQTDSSYVKNRKPVLDSLQQVAKTDLNIFPNPAKNKVTLQVKGYEPGLASVKILDTRGKMVRQESRLLTNGEEDIILFLMLPPGIYFVIVSEKGKVSRRKLVMQ